jgi:hypothetical protein
MKRAFLVAVFLVAVLLLPFSPPAFGGAPKLNAQAICKARAADAKILRSVPMQSLADCVHDEEAAKQQLSSLWEAISASVRKQCEGDGRALGTTSYLDLLTCVQMADDIKSSPKKQPGKP